MKMLVSKKRHEKVLQTVASMKEVVDSVSPMLYEVRAIRDQAFDKPRTRNRGYLSERDLIKIGRIVEHHLLTLDK